MNIKELTLEQLKALAYDQLAQIEQAKNNLVLINQEISVKSQETPVEKNQVKNNGK